MRTGAYRRGTPDDGTLLVIQTSFSATWCSPRRCSPTSRRPIRSTSCALPPPARCSRIIRRCARSSATTSAASTAERAGSYNWHQRFALARYDAAYLAQGSPRSGALALAAGIRERVGFATSAGRLFYTTRIPPRREHPSCCAPAVARHRRSAALTFRATRLRPRLYPGDAERAAVDAVLGDTDGDARIIALAPGSVWATKRWPFYAAARA